MALEYVDEYVEEIEKKDASITYEGFENWLRTASDIVSNEHDINTVLRCAREEKIFEPSAPQSKISNSNGFGMASQAQVLGLKRINPYH